MLQKFIQTRKYKSIVPDLYNDIVAQSRQVQFYEEYGVDDDFEGRFNMLSIHMILVLDRLQKEEKEGANSTLLNQILVDHFFDDIDGVLRETGTGDMAVSHRIKKLANKFYGRMKIFQKSFEEDDKDLEQAVWRNIYPKRVDDGEEDAAKMTDYIVKTRSHLKGVPFANFAAAKLIFS